LFRPKWDEYHFQDLIHGRLTYGQGTIKKALTDPGECYHGPAESLAPNMLDGVAQVAPSPSIRELVIESFASCRIKPVRWLVHGYIPLGKLVVIAGDGGHGKSVLTICLAADLSRGCPCLGLDYPALEPCDSLIISCEDDADDTVCPRILAAGGDVNRIYRLTGTKDLSGKTLPFDLSCYEALETTLIKNPNIRLVILDPAGAYVGRVDDYKDSALRTLLGPLSELAARRDVTIVLIKHLVKGATIKAVDKIGGSAGYVNAVRAAFMVLPDATTPDLKYFLPVKANIMVKPVGLAFTLQGLPVQEGDAIVRDYGKHLNAKQQEDLKKQLFRLQWQGPVTIDANKVLAAQVLDPAAKKDREEAREADKKAKEDGRVAAAVNAVHKAGASPVTANQIGESLGWSGSTRNRVLKQAEESGKLEVYKAEVEAGSGTRKVRDCYRLPTGQPATPLQNSCQVGQVGSCLNANGDLNVSSDVHQPEHTDHPDHPDQPISVLVNGSRGRIGQTPSLQSNNRTSEPF
jgi:hypothetical protein